MKWRLFTIDIVCVVWRVEDISIFPAQTTENTNAPKMSMAARAVELILGQGASEWSLSLAFFTIFEQGAL
jgi:hypothetical protein|tara:strand:+ start:2400 stop:2609 length:210 start_codon:yes stop_codon:yes gene_type:complete